MKKDLHPVKRKVAFVDNIGWYTLIVNSTVQTTTTYTHEGVEYPCYNIEVSSKSHPFYTGEQKILKTGAVDKFYARQKKMEEMKKSK